jgi:hypothetical protein
MNKLSTLLVNLIESYYKKVLKIDNKGVVERYSQNVFYLFITCVFVVILFSTFFGQDPISYYIYFIAKQLGKGHLIKEDLLFMTFGLIPSIVIGSIIMVEGINPACGVRYNLLNLLLYLPIPGKKDRLKEVNAFRDEYKNKILSDFNKLNNASSRSDELINEFKKDPKAFVENYFQPGQSLARHFLQRASLDGQINLAFIFNALLIPYRKTLPVENLKAIFNAICQNTELPPIALCFTVIDEQKGERLFQKYSAQNLTLVFTKYIDFKAYWMLLEKSSDPFEVYRSINQIVDHTLGKEFYNNPGIYKANGHSYKQMRVKVLKVKQDYDQIAQDFTNCLKSFYGDKYTGDIVCFYKEGFPMYCLELSHNFKLVEIKGPLNVNVDKKIQKELVYFLKKMGT